MPNWVNNHMLVTGKDEQVKLFMDKVAQPTRYKMVRPLSDQPEEVEERRLFSFFNVIAPAWEMMDEYAQQPKHSKLLTSDPNWWADTTEIMATDNSWYNWNIRNWGTKWDASEANFQYLPNETLGRTRVLYTFDTAWDYPEPVYVEMAKQWPQLNFYIRALEETGWGVILQFKEGANVLYKSKDPAPRNFLERLIKTR